MGFLRGKVMISGKAFPRTCPKPPFGEVGGAQKKSCPIWAAPNLISKKDTIYLPGIFCTWYGIYPHALLYPQV
jgi:hypothetical protein